MRHKNYRNGDPHTSVEAGRAIENSGTARTHRDICRADVQDHPGSASNEVEARTGIKAHKRLPELRREGLVHNGLARSCHISHKQAITWWAGPDPGQATSQ